MTHVERHQHILERRQRSSFANVVFTESFQGRRPHLHNVRESVEDIAAVIPQMRYRTGAACRPSVLISQVHQAARECITQDSIERRTFVD